MNSVTSIVFRLVTLQFFSVEIELSWTIVNSNGVKCKCLSWRAFYNKSDVKRRSTLGWLNQYTTNTNTTQEVLVCSEEQNNVSTERIEMSRVWRVYFRKWLYIYSTLVDKPNTKKFEFRVNLRSMSINPENIRVLNQIILHRLSEFVGASCGTGGELSDGQTRVGCCKKFPYIIHQ